MHRLLILFLLPFCMSCLWDRDTLKEEGKGRMEVVEVIIGWFDRYPPEYYEARLARVIRELESDPHRLSLYDDAGVALDRLHRSDDAIEIMAKKKAVMASAEFENKESLWEHQYRYLANLGTFHVHRWIGQKKKIRDADLGDLKKAEELIAAAIEHNPDAHFGREKYQLLAIRWLQTGALYLDDETIPGPLGPGLDEGDTEEALEGFLGMIKLGSAWESTDFFNTVAELLADERRRVLAAATLLRVDELKEAGRGSLHPLGNRVQYSIWGGTSPEREKDVAAWFPKARQAADKRQENRWAYLRKGLADGRHPDTDPDFWEGWKEPKFPSPPGMTIHSLTTPRGLMVLALIGLVSFLIVLWVISALRRRKARRSMQ